MDLYWNTKICRGYVRINSIIPECNTGANPIYPWFRRYNLKRTCVISNHSAENGYLILKDGILQRGV